ncbi:MAG TPA: IPT/TIG domain-containing protein [Mucilaginibacter sp.]
MKPILCYFFLFVLAIGIVSCTKKHASDEIHPVTPPITTTPINITGISPAQAVTGSDIMIKGSGFDPTLSNNVVKIGTVNAIVKAVTDTSLIITIPDNALTGKITVTKGSLSATTDREYYMVGPFDPDFRLREFVDGHRNVYDFEYDSKNRVTFRRENYRIIDQFIINLASAEYSYNSAGLLEKEVRTPVGTVAGSSDTTWKITEYFYTNGILSSDKVSSMNTAKTVSTVLFTHTYSFIGNQLLKTITKNAAGVQTSVETYTYSNVNDEPTVVRQINSVTDGLSTETYYQHPGEVDPYAYCIPGAPKPSLFLTDSARFSNPIIPSYSAAVDYPSIEQHVIYSYKAPDVGAFEAVYYLEPKQ